MGEGGVKGDTDRQISAIFIRIIFEAIQLTGNGRAEDEMGQEIVPK